MATIIGLNDNIARYNKERWGEDSNHDWNSDEYNRYLDTEKSVMTDEDAKNMIAKIKEYYDSRNDIWGDVTIEELNEKYELLFNARKGYREKLENEKAENIEDKVNNLYPYEEIFSYNYLRD